MSRVVVLVGASADLTGALARDLAASGDRVAVVVDPTSDLVVGDLRARTRGRTPLRVVADVRDPDAVELVLDEVEELLGPVEVWVGTVPAVAGCPSGDLHPVRLRVTTDEVYLALAHTTLAVLERMTARGGGTVVQVVPGLAGREAAGRAAEAGALAAARGFADALAAELRTERSPVRLHHLQVGPDDDVSAVAREVVRIAHRPAHRGRRLLRAGAVGGGAAVLLRRRRR